MDTSTSTAASTTTATPGNARQLVATALTLFADVWTGKLEAAPDALDLASVTRDIALARTMASNTTGWTHTTRLREFLDSERTAEEIAGELIALAAKADELETAVAL